MLALAPMLLPGLLGFCWCYVAPSSFLVLLFLGKDPQNFA